MRSKLVSEKKDELEQGKIDKRKWKGDIEETAKKWKEMERDTKEEKVDGRTY